MLPHTLSINNYAGEYSSEIREAKNEELSKKDRMREQNNIPCEAKNEYRAGSGGIHL